MKSKICQQKAKKENVTGRKRSHHLRHRSIIVESRLCHEDNVPKDVLFSSNIPSSTYTLCNRSSQSSLVSAVPRFLSNTKKDKSPPNLNNDWSHTWNGILKEFKLNWREVYFDLSHVIHAPLGARAYPWILSKYFLSVHASIHPSIRVSPYR